MKRAGILLLTVIMIMVLAPMNAFAAESDTFDQDMTGYLSEISTTRGFEITREDITSELAKYDLITADFASVEEMKSFLGDVIQADLSNLDEIYTYYELDQTSLTNILAEYGEEINDYIFVDDLDSALDFYTYDETDDQVADTSDINPEDIMSIFTELGITDAEIQKMTEYYISMGDYLADPEVQEKLQSLSTRLMTIGTSFIEKGTADEDFKPTEAELNELVSIYDELLTLMKLNMKFYLVENGASKPITFQELLNLEEMGKNDLQIELYTTEGELLADMTMPGEQGASGLEEIIDGVKESDNKDYAVKTVKGGTLPTTASNYLLYSLLGFLVSVAGACTYLKVRKDKFESSEKQA